MLIVALVLAVVGLAALVTAVVTSNELIAWVCIAASVIGVILLIVDAVRDRSSRDEDDKSAEEPETVYDEDYPEEAPGASEYEGDAEYDDAPAAETTAADVAHDPETTDAEDTTKR